MTIAFISIEGLLIFSVVLLLLDQRAVIQDRE